jgi:hypothetical protein
MQAIPAISLHPKKRLLVGGPVAAGAVLSAVPSSKVPRNRFDPIRTDSAGHFRLSHTVYRDRASVSRAAEFRLRPAIWVLGPAPEADDLGYIRAMSAGLSCDLVFISYSHANPEWRDRLMLLLKPFVRQGRLQVWADPAATDTLAPMALDLMARWASVDLKELPPVATTVARELDYLPLGLAGSRRSRAGSVLVMYALSVTGRHVATS